MARKSANNLKKGNYFMYEGEPFMVLTNDHSKSGKHGHAKSRVGCVSLFGKKKKSLTMTADTSLEVPEIQKRQGQLVDIDEQNQILSVMDLESYETMDVDFPFEDDEVNLDKVKELIADPDMVGDTNIEFWTVVGRSFATRIVLPK
ncbi:MAG: translation initiation factor IF-5A [Promethearchaeota archaeon]